MRIIYQWSQNQQQYLNGVDDVLQLIIAAKGSTAILTFRPDGEQRWFFSKELDLNLEPSSDNA